jgi:hypothetical protein
VLFIKVRINFGTGQCHIFKLQLSDYHYFPLASRPS